MTIKPSPHWHAARIYDETPLVVSRNLVGEKQRLLSLVRHNRLIDRFFNSVAHSLGSWTGKFGKSHAEIDEIYVIMNTTGREFIVPVQVQCHNDRNGVVQTKQNIAWCQAKFPKLPCLPISVQFTDTRTVALLEHCAYQGKIMLKDQHHYKIIPLIEPESDTNCSL